MPDNSNGSKHWMEYLRLITPFLLFVLTMYNAYISGQLRNIDDKLFKHLTNDEIHAPRSFCVDKTSFDLYQKMRDKEMFVVYENVARICADLRLLSMEIRNSTRGIDHGEPYRFNGGELRQK